MPDSQLRDRVSETVGRARQPEPESRDVARALFAEHLDLAAIRRALGQQAVPRVPAAAPSAPVEHEPPAGRDLLAAIAPPPAPADPTGDAPADAFAPRRPVAAPVIEQALGPALAVVGGLGAVILAVAVWPLWQPVAGNGPPAIAAMAAAPPLVAPPNGLATTAAGPPPLSPVGEVAPPLRGAPARALAPATSVPEAVAPPPAPTFAAEAGPAASIRVASLAEPAPSRAPVRLTATSAAPVGNASVPPASPPGDARLSPAPAIRPAPPAEPPAPSQVSARPRTPPAARPAPVAAAATSTRVVVHHHRALTAAFRQALEGSLRRAGVARVEWRRVGDTVSHAQTRFFHPADKALADRAVASLAALNRPASGRDFTHYDPPARPGTVEIWLSE